MSIPDQGLVETYFKGMAAGADGEQDLMSVFADDAVYVEPFTGGPGVRLEHTGKQAIHEFFLESYRQQMTPIEITLQRVDVDGDELRSEWHCTMPGIPPFSGHDQYTIRDGKIARLEVFVDRMPG